MSMYKIAFLGEERILAFYRPAGFTLFSPETEQETRDILTRLQRENYSIVFVTEAVYKQAEKVIQSLDREFLPAVVILPGFGEHEQVGALRLNGLMEKAVGIKLQS